MVTSTSNPADSAAVISCDSVWVLAYDIFRISFGYLSDIYKEARHANQNPYNTNRFSLP